MTETKNTLSPFQRKLNEIERVARSLFEHQPTWTLFHRELFGVGGAIPRLFPGDEEMSKFKESPICTVINDMVRALRETAPAPYEGATRVITVRIPASLHETLRWEAQQLGVSMNRLCITRLLETDET
jgi:predicted HicB family RNase H-like nuclease